MTKITFIYLHIVIKWCNLKVNEQRLVRKANKYSKNILKLLDTGTEPQATQKLQESGLQDRIQE